MYPITNKKIIIRFLAVAAVLMLTFIFNDPAHAQTQKTFASGDQAVSAFINAMKENNNGQLLEIFGPDANELIYSGDPSADSQRRQFFLTAYDIQHKLETNGDKLILVVGKNDWPFPIPLVKEKQQWVFDTDAGKEEIINRRIGRNELITIQVMLAIVDAQREYASIDRDGDGICEYAQKFKSDPNKTDGLFWETKQGDKPSPLGPLVAMARQRGYLKNQNSNGPQPYHGYYYRILTSQGPSAQGGAFDYIVKGKMVGGFAVIAYPAEYGNSGVMTFIVNYDGIVYQKDLGENTQPQAGAIKLFDPDKTWVKSQ